ncbi:LysR family transcriptional regulator [Flindersiella endophytica]
MATLRQLEYLVTVIDTGSFTRAAETLHVTQPALSHQIQALERVVGGRLLERLPRSVRLTPMGRALLPHARAALADAALAVRSARQVGELEAGEIQVATLYSISHGVLPPALKAWRRSCPAVQVRLFEHRHADELLAATASGRADVAIGAVPPAWDGPVHALGVEEFVVVVPADDALAGRRRIRLRTLADRDWVHYAPGNGLGELLDQACAAEGFAPRAAVRTEQSAAAPMLAAAGLGPALVPANIIPPRFDGCLLRPQPAIRRMLAAYTRSGGTDPLTAAFIETLVRHACVMPAHVQRALEPARS